MPAPGGIVPPNLVPNLRIDLRTNQNAKGKSTSNLANKVDLCEWINYWMENGCITGGATEPGGPFILYAENGLHKKAVDDPLAANANSTVHLGGALTENTWITGGATPFGIGFQDTATVQIDNSGVAALALPSLQILNTPDTLSATKGISLVTDGRVVVGSNYAGGEAMLQVFGVGTVDPLRVNVPGTGTILQVEDNGDLIFRPRITGVGNINDIITNIDGFGRAEWKDPGTIFTGGSGIEIAGTIINWNGALTQIAAIDGINTYNIEFNQVPIFSVAGGETQIDSTTLDINSTFVDIDSPTVTWNGTDMTLDGGGTVTVEGNVTLINGDTSISFDSPNYDFATPPATDNTATKMLMLDGSNDIKERTIDSLITNRAAGNYAVLTTDEVILKTAITIGGDTITLPSTARTGQRFIIKDASGTAGTRNITVDTAGAENIDGDPAGVIINGNYDGIEVIFDGSNYFVINKV